MSHHRDDGEAQDGPASRGSSGIGDCQFPWSLVRYHGWTLTNQQTTAYMAHQRLVRRFLAPKIDVPLAPTVG
jgi:hypothetical protein